MQNALTRLSYRILSIVFLLLAAAAVSGCAMMPDSRENVSKQGTFDHFVDIDWIFEYAITPGKTTVEELAQMKVGPGSRGVVEMGAVEAKNFILGRKGTKEDLPTVVRECIRKNAARSATCSGLVVRFHRKRGIGKESYWAHIVKREKKTLKTGWEFMGILVVEDGVVVAKIKRRRVRNINKIEHSKNPRGLIDKSLDLLPIPFL